MLPIKWRPEGTTGWSQTIGILFGVSTACVFNIPALGELILYIPRIQLLNLMFYSYRSQSFRFEPTSVGLITERFLK